MEIEFTDIPKQTRFACKSLGIPDIVVMNYARSLKRHITFVIQAWVETLGLDYGEIEYHDHSKWFPEEFPGYAKHFFGGGDINALVRSWQHHLHNNPHHWQYWMFPDGYSPVGADVVDGCIFMPDNYVCEMVADWIGASLSYAGTDNMTDWLKNNYGKIRLHPKSKYLLDTMLYELGYKPDQL